MHFHTTDFSLMLVPVRCHNNNSITQCKHLVLIVHIVQNNWPKDGDDDHFRD